MYTERGFWVVCTWREALGRYVPGGRLLGSMYLEGGFRVKGGSRGGGMYLEGGSTVGLYVLHLHAIIL